MPQRKLPPIPKSIKGLTSDYKVTSHTQDLANAGEHDPVHFEIRVNRPGNLNHEWEVFMHELLHKWLNEASVKMFDTDETPDVDRLSCSILGDFLRNNWRLPGE